MNPQQAQAQALARAQAHAQQVAAEISRALQQEAERLRHAFDGAARQWVSVTFEGPLAVQFALRMQQRMQQVNSVVTKMGGMAEQLAKQAGITGQQGGGGHGGGGGGGHGGGGGGGHGGGGGGGHGGGGGGGHGGGGGGGHATQGLRVDGGDGSDPGGTIDGSKLAARYQEYLPFVEKAAKKYNVDPALILAVMARETNGRNILGDGGHGHGLMQIDDRSHGGWLRGHGNGLDPESNIDYGTSILAGNIRRFPGNLQAAVAAYNAGAGGVSKQLRLGHSPDMATTGHNYGADVLRRRDEFRQLLGR